MTNLAQSFQRLALFDTKTISKLIVPARNVYFTGDTPKPKPGTGVSYRRIIHYPKEYTVKPLDNTHLAGRDPVSGRLVVKGIGGGIKHKYHWIDWKRVGPKEGPPQLERVIKIIEDGCRTAHVALVAVGDRLKYILATENMKAGDLLKTSCHIPRIPVKANEGDAYPLGALPVGTQINCVELYPGLGGFLAHAAGTFATILRKTPEGRVIVLTPSKKEFSIPQECMCTVGRLSNVAHGSTPIGSAQRNRWLGNRPRSGWWQRKTGKHGRKIRPPPPVKVLKMKGEANMETVSLTMSSFTRNTNYKLTNERYM